VQTLLQVQTLFTAWQVQTLLQVHTLLQVQVFSNFPGTQLQVQVAPGGKGDPQGSV